MQATDQGIVPSRVQHGYRPPSYSPLPPNPPPPIPSPHCLATLDLRGHCTRGEGDEVGGLGSSGEVKLRSVFRDPDQARPLRYLLACPYPCRTCLVVLKVLLLRHRASSMRCSLADSKMTFANSLKLFRVQPTYVQKQVICWI